MELPCKITALLVTSDESSAPQMMPPVDPAHHRQKRLAALSLLKSPPPLEFEFAIWYDGTKCADKEENVKFAHECLHVNQSFSEQNAVFHINNWLLEYV